MGEASYMDVVDSSLEYFGGQACVHAVRSGVQAVAQLLETRVGRREVRT